ncbi:MAG: biotin/lipoate A/B protein ligase family protein, partial [Anaerolineales bacterium]
MTLCIHNQHTDPYFNLAAEEHLLRKVEEDVFMLWRNEPSIIIGRNQNAYSEINIDFVRRKNIKVVRRLSGGGAVFHDLGNVNFTFIATNPEGPKLHFQRYTDPIIAALSGLGVEARFEGRNDLTIDGRKISGNAQHIYRDRVLH